MLIFTDDQVDAQQGKTVFGEDNTVCEISLEQEGIMDFAEVEIAEQLTHIDSVRNKMLRSSCFHCQTWTYRLMVVFHWVSGSVY